MCLEKIVTKEREHLWSGLTEYGKLYSTREFKKQRLVYFDDAFEAWEEEALTP